MWETCKAIQDGWKTVDIPTHQIKGGRWVEIVANIRHNATGEVRAHTTNAILMDGETTPSAFNWSDNNFSCDCNRVLFFLRSKGEDEARAWENVCTDGKYSVQLVNPVTGLMYYREF